MALIALPFLAAALGAAPPAIPWLSLGQGPTLSAQGRLPSLITSRSQTVHASHYLRPEHAARLAGVDYRTRVAVIAQRTFPTCGYALAVRKLSLVSRTLRVNVRVTPPAAGAGVCQAFTTPYHAITVARRALGRRLPARVVFTWSVARARA